jgi:YD repeat-containing protein
VRYTAQGMGGTLFFTPQEIVLTLPTAPLTPTTRPDRRPPLQATPAISLSVLRIQYEGTSATSALTAGLPLPGLHHSLVGTDRTKWATDLPSYEDIRYQQLYAGIDLVYSGDAGQLKSTYYVAPGSDPSQIRWRYQGADEVSVDADGNLVVTLRGRGAGGTTPAQQLVEQAPIAWQVLPAGGQLEVRARYVVGPQGRVRFALDGYDPALPLVIDPVITLNVRLGGSLNNDDADDVAVDRQGNVYVTGRVATSDFPVTGQGLSTGLQGEVDAVVLKLDARGNLVFSTYLGSSAADEGRAIAVDASQHVYVAGATGVDNFPLVHALPLTIDDDAGVKGFVAKLSPSGATLLYSTLLGGATHSDAVSGLTVDAQGAVAVVGTTSSPGFPTTANAAYPSFRGGSADIFVATLAFTGSSLALSYATYLGGNGTDTGSSIARDASGRLAITGTTASTNAAAGNAYDSSLGGAQDALVSILRPDGTLVVSTYLGGSASEWGQGLALDPQGQAYLVGRSTSTDYPTTAQALDPTANGADDIVVTKLRADGSGLVYSTYLGGSSIDDGADIVVEATGQAAIVGYTRSVDYPTRQALSATLSDDMTGIVSVLDPQGRRLVYSTLLPGAYNPVLAVASAGAGTYTLVSDRTVASTVTRTYDANGQQGFSVVTLDDTARTSPRTRVTSYQYDGLLRLTAASESPGTVYSYTYDLAGNRLQTWEDGALIASRSYNAANQVATDALSGQAWSYDGAGNLLSDGQATYQYDALSRLITTTAGIQARAYGYNGQGVLITETVKGLTTRYAQDLVSPLSQVLSSTGGLTATHLYGRERLASVEGSNRTWYVPDALGSVRATLNTAGDVLSTHRYDPYGTPQLGDQPCSFGFTGEMHDVPAGLVNLRARWYDTPCPPGALAAFEAGGQTEHQHELPQPKRSGPSCDLSCRRAGAAPACAWPQAERARSDRPDRRRDASGRARGPALRAGCCPGPAGANRRAGARRGGRAGAAAPRRGAV